MVNMLSYLEKFTAW